MICNKIEIAFASDTVPMFVPLLYTNNVVYSMDTDPNNSAGNVKKQTVIVEAYSKDVQDLINSRELYVLKLYTDDNSFIVGSSNFPARKTIRDDKKTTTITFECESAV